MAQAAELTPQSAEKFTGILPSINTDLTTDEILQIARESKIPATEIPKIDLIEQLQKNYPNFTDFQKNITRTLSRGMLNIVLRSYTVPSFTDALLVSVPVMDVILNTRNKHLARAIIDSPSQHIYIQYGALHYDGVLKLLRENDNRWAEVSRKEIVVIR